MSITVQPYRQQVELGSAPGVSGSNERMRPTGVGEAITDLGQAGSKAYATFERLKNEDAHANAVFAISDTNVSLEEQLQKAKETAQPGAPEFSPKMGNAFDAEVNKRAEALPDEATRKVYREKMGAQRDNFVIRSATWEATERQRNRVQNFSKAVDNDANQLFATDAASRGVVYGQQQQTFDDALNQIEMEPAAREGLREEARNKRSYAAVQGDLRDRPDKVQDWLVKGTGTGYFSNLKGAESGGRNIGSESSSAFGPYQFTSGTWKRVIERHPDLNLSEADRFKPEAQEIAIRAFTNDNAETLKNNGLPRTDLNLYMTHLLGESGGPRFVKAAMTNPSDDARLHALPSQVAANPSIFNGRTTEQVMKLFAGKFGDKETYSQVSDAPTYYSDVPFAKRDMMYGQAEQEMNKRRVQGEAAFKQTVDNAIAEFATTGASVQRPTEQQFVAALGAPRGTQAYGEFTANATAAEASYRVQRMPLAEGTQYVESLKPKAGDPFFAEKAKGYAAARDVSDRIRASAVTDFGQHVITFNDGARAALTTAMSSSNPDEAEAAAQSYARILDTEATRLGVPGAGRGFLPKSYSQQIAATLDQKLGKDVDAAAVVGTLNQFKARWGGNWGRVYGEIRDTLSPTLQVVTSGIAPRAAMTLVTVHNQSFEDLAKILPKTQKTEIGESLQEAFQPFVTSTMWQQSSLPTVTTFFEQAKKLSAVYTSQGMKPDEAATQAYNDVIGSKYRIVNGNISNIRVPLKEDFPEIEEVLRFQRRDVINTRIGANPSDPLAKIDQAAADDAVRQEYADDSMWVTVQNEKGEEAGVGLMRGKELRTDKFGNKIEFTWAQLRAAKEPMQARRKAITDPDSGGLNWWEGE